MIVIDQINANELIERLESLKNSIEKALETKQCQEVKEKEYLTRKEVADKLKICLVTLNFWTKKGAIKAYKIGHRVYYKPKEVEQALIRMNGK